MKFEVVPYNPLWPQQFQDIKDALQADFESCNAQYVSIEHVGSTSVPSLTAKPIIDILVVVADRLRYPQIREALVLGDRQGGYRHIGDGGVKDRWSFKLPAVVPERNLYVVVANSIPHRSCVDLRDTLRQDEQLRNEYQEKKMELAKFEWWDVMEYATAKNDVVRKILKKAGWSDDEVDEKEKRAVKKWSFEDGYL